jgi:hypothetical protein
MAYSKKLKTHECIRGHKLIRKYPSNIAIVKSNTHIESFIIPIKEKIIGFKFGEIDEINISEDELIHMSKSGIRNIEIFDNKYFDDATHMIVPLYYHLDKYGNKIKDVYEDCGLAVLGKCHKDELFCDASIREVVEELGIHVEKYKLKLSNSIYHEK